VDWLLHDCLYMPDSGVFVMSFYCGLFLCRISIIYDVPGVLLVCDKMGRDERRGLGGRDVQAPITVNCFMDSWRMLLGSFPCYDYY